MLKVYHHPRCSTCKKALSFLKKNSVSHTAIDLTEQSPTKSELSKMLSLIEPAKIFNTSGKRYRELNIKEQRETMTKSQIAELLADEPMLIKRPFLLTKDFGLVGFKENEWKSLL
ncbi:MAG: Spx/MgsR family RNA polymerase-binding regulatory protein [Bdellovibrionales bacterium]|nr:Spx/MgsR family RNA polymerase-binding regulatory protein [Bdellovibrionales bacterium]